ncbi:MarR family transcriptional regulator [Nocardioides hankookensis]|uniref:MarR family winged helix-turn-helix transcriptional regulator n=1 Tax=Nocardioides hankookensis TaxID=443157 RepID=A0ABW1LNS6_9ACTN
MEYPQLDLDVQLCFPLYAASRAITREYTELLAEVGLTYPQYLVMLALWGTPSLSVSEIGRRLQLDSGTLTPLLKRLEAAGLVTRARDPEDERRVIVTLTADGRALQHEVAEVPLRLWKSLGLSPEEYDALRASLAKVLANLAATPPESLDA